MHFTDRSQSSGVLQPSLQREGWSDAMDFSEWSTEESSHRITGKGSRNGLSVLMADSLVNRNMLDAGAQCFPFYLCEKVTSRDDFLNGAEEQDGYHCRHSITEAGFAYFRKHTLERS